MLLQLWLSQQRQEWPGLQATPSLRREEDVALRMAGLAGLDGWANALFLPLYSIHIPLEDGCSEEDYLPQTQEASVQ